MTPPSNGPILLYDGECGLCGAAVRFVIRWDHGGHFRFAPLDSPAGIALRERHGIAPAIDSIVVISGQTARVRSQAVFEILRQIGGLWHLLRVGSLLPVAWCDRLYDWVAGHRSRLSQRVGLQCLRPNEALKSRFL